MSNRHLQTVNGLRGLGISALAAVLLFSGLAAAERHSPLPATKQIDEELHTTPNFGGAAQGLRESGPEEVQRIEQTGNRTNLARAIVPSDFFEHNYSHQISENNLTKPLLLIKEACLDATLHSLAHALLSSRYPIPPPTPLA